MKKNKLNIAISTALAASLSGAATFSALAAETQGEQDEVKKIERVQVTGSKIARPGTDTIRPALVIDSEMIDKRAFTNVADILNESPVFGAGVTPDGDQNSFTVGQNYVNLFSLGTQRTLTLVNGRRFVSSNVPTTFGSAGGLQVDMNAIPTALIKDIEVVPMAGAGVYGSDAIAGVVNVILKDDYEGLEFSTNWGTSEERDGDSKQFQIVAGTNFADDRGNLAFSMEYAQQDGLLRESRPEFIDNDPSYLNFGGLDLDGDGENDDVDGDGRPDTFRRIIEGGQRVQLLTAGGAIAPPGSFFAPSIGRGQLEDGNFYQFMPNGNLETCEPGVTPAGSPFFAFGGTCGEDFFDMVEQLRSPLERIVVSLNAHYDITEDIRFSQEFNYSNSEARELSNQGGFQSFPFGGTSGFIAMDIDNPFLNDQAKSVLSANGLEQFSLNRFNNDIVQNGQDLTENHTWRSYTGLEGNFEIADRMFSWDVGAVFGQADVETRSLGIVDGRFLNAIDAVALSADTLDPVLQKLLADEAETAGSGDFNGDGVVNSADALGYFNLNGGSGLAKANMGDIVCRANIQNAAGTLTGANAAPTFNGTTDEDLPYVTGCMPLNLFGQNAASPEALAFINGGPGITSSNITQRVFNAGISGELIELPAGYLAFAAGYETRLERAEFTPGLGTSVPITRSSPFVPTRGQLETQEFFTELLVPLVASDMDIPFVYNAEIEGSVRRVKNEVTGPDGFSSEETVTAWEAGFKYAPIEDISFRATFSNGIRTPSLVELFTPRVQAFVSGSDPCDNRFVNQGPDPDTRRANCIADGITDPDNFTSNISNATIKGASQGNPDLVAEKSTAYSYGVVFTPSFVEDLTVTIDYYNIEIDDRIGAFEFDTLAEACYDTKDFPNVDACNQFKRDSDGQVVDVTELQLNAATSEFEAVNFGVFYNFELAEALSLFGGNFDNLGEFDVKVTGTRNLKNMLQLVSTREADRTVGGFTRPFLTTNLDVTYNYDDWRAFWRVAYQSAAELDPRRQSFYLLGENDDIVYKGSPNIIHNASLAHFISDSMSVQLTVNNVFAHKPGWVDWARGNVKVTEEIGRTYGLKFKVAF